METCEIESETIQPIKPVSTHVMSTRSPNNIFKQKKLFLDTNHQTSIACKPTSATLVVKDTN